MKTVNAGTHVRKLLKDVKDPAEGTIFKKANGLTLKVEMVWASADGTLHVQGGNTSYQVAPKDTMEVPD